MNGNVFGSIKLDISIPVENTDETLALMEANFKLHPERLIYFELYAVDCKGHRFKVDTHNTGKVDFNVFFEV